MLVPMVATPAFDLIVAIVWVGGLTLFLLCRALISWQRFRRTAEIAAQARRLSEATRQTVIPRASGKPADVIPFRARTPAPAGQKSKL